MRIFTDLDEFAAAEGQTLGTSDWLTVEQERVNTFADATGDHQWIHVDPERAAQGPFGGAIAHGYLTLSLLPVLMAGIYRVDGVAMAINYGLNRVRFPSPVLVGARIRVTSVLTTVTVGQGFVESVVTSTVEIEGGAKPACVAETVVRLYRPVPSS